MDALETKVGHKGVASVPGKAATIIGPTIGSPAPAFELPILSGGSTVTLETLRAEHRPTARMGRNVVLDLASKSGLSTLPAEKPSGSATLVITAALTPHPPDPEFPAGCPDTGPIQDRQKVHSVLA